MLTTRSKGNNTTDEQSLKGDPELKCTRLDIHKDSSALGISVKRFKTNNGSKTAAALESNLKTPSIGETQQLKLSSPTSSPSKSSGLSHRQPARYQYATDDTPEQTTKGKTKHKQYTAKSSEEDKETSGDMSESPTDADASFEQSPERTGEKTPIHDEKNQSHTSKGLSIIDKDDENQQHSYEDSEIPLQLQNQQLKTYSPQQFLEQLEEEHRHVLEETQRKVSNVASSVYSILLGNLAEAKCLYQAEEIRNMQLKGELGDVTEALKQVQSEVTKVLHGSDCLQE
jgi:hypothetical protein